MTLQLELKLSTQAKLHDESVRLGLHEEELARQLIDQALNPELTPKQIAAIENLDRMIAEPDDEDEDPDAWTNFEKYLAELDNVDCELCRCAKA